MNTALFTIVTLEITVVTIAFVTCHYYLYPTRVFSKLPWVDTVLDKWNKDGIVSYVPMILVSMLAAVLLGMSPITQSTLIHSMFKINAWAIPAGILEVVGVTCIWVIDNSWSSFSKKDLGKFLLTYIAMNVFPFVLLAIFFGIMTLVIT